MFRILDTLGGTFVTHVAAGVAGYLYARNLVTAEQAQNFITQVQQHWPELLLAIGGVGGAAAGKVATNRE